MKNPMTPWSCGVLLITVSGFWLPTSAQQSCESLKSLELPNVTITSATAITPPWKVPAQTGFLSTPEGLSVAVPFCRL